MVWRTTTSAIMARPARTPILPDRTRPLGQKVLATLAEHGWMTVPQLWVTVWGPAGVSLWQGYRAARALADADLIQLEHLDPSAGRRSHLVASLRPDGWRLLRLRPRRGPNCRALERSRETALQRAALLIRRHADGFQLVDQSQRYAAMRRALLQQLGKPGATEERRLRYSEVVRWAAREVHAELLQHHTGGVRVIVPVRAGTRVSTLLAKLPPVMQYALHHDWEILDVDRVRLTTALRLLEAYSARAGATCHIHCVPPFRSIRYLTP